MEISLREFTVIGPRFLRWWLELWPGAVPLEFLPYFIMLRTDWGKEGGSSLLIPIFF